MKRIVIFSALLLWIINASLLFAGDARVVSCKTTRAKLDTAYYEAHTSDSKNAADRFSSLSREIRKTLKTCPHDAHLLSMLAETYIPLGRNDMAIRYARQAMSADPMSWEANHSLGTLLNMSGDFKKGIPHLEKAANIAPENEFLLYNLCSAYEWASEYDKAVQICTRVIEKRNPATLAPALFLRGKAYNALERKEAALKDFEQAELLGFDGSKFYPGKDTLSK